MLDINHTNTITHDEFIRGITKLKGLAQSVEVLQILKEIQKMRKSLRQMTREMIDGQKTGLSSQTQESTNVELLRAAAWGHWRPGPRCHSVEPVALHQLEALP